MVTRRAHAMKPCRIIEVSWGARHVAFEVPAFISALGALIARRRCSADEGGVSFWLPGFFGSLAAAPQQPGWSLPTYYHTSVSAAADVAIARESTLGNIPVNVNLSANLSCQT